MRNRLVLFSLVTALPAFADFSDYLIQSQIQRQQQQNAAAAGQSASERRSSLGTPKAPSTDYSQQLKGIQDQAGSLLTTIQTLADQSGRSSQLLSGLLGPSSDKSSDSSSSSSDNSQIVGQDTLLLAIKKAGEKPAEGTGSEEVVQGTIKDLIADGAKTNQQLVMSAAKQAQLALQQQAEILKQQGKTSDASLAASVQELEQTRGGDEAHAASHTRSGSGNAFGFALSRHPASAGATTRGARRR